jgi:hypothetical protein
MTFLLCNFWHYSKCHYLKYADWDFISYKPQNFTYCGVEFWWNKCWWESSYYYQRLISDRHRNASWWRTQQVITAPENELPCAQWWTTHTRYDTKQWIQPCHITAVFLLQSFDELVESSPVRRSLKLHEINMKYKWPSSSKEHLQHRYHILVHTYIFANHKQQLSSESISCC